MTLGVADDESCGGYAKLKWRSSYEREWIYEGDKLNVIVVARPQVFRSTGEPCCSVSSHG